MELNTCFSVCCCLVWRSMRRVCPETAAEACCETCAVLHVHVLRRMYAGLSGDTMDAPPPHMTRRHSCQAAQTVPPVPSHRPTSIPKPTAGISSVEPQTLHPLRTSLPLKPSTSPAQPTIPTSWNLGHTHLVPSITPRLLCSASLTWPTPLLSSTTSSTFETTC